MLTTTQPARWVKERRGKVALCSLPWEGAVGPKPDEKWKGSMVMAAGPSATSTSTPWRQPACHEPLRTTLRNPGKRHQLSPDPRGMSFPIWKLLLSILLTYQKQLFKFTVCSLDVLQGQEVAWQVFSFDNFIRWPVDDPVNSRNQKITSN